MYKSEKKFYQKSFLYALIMAAALFLPFVIIDGGYFIFYGDYNAQQIPFFKHCVEAVHNGTLGWDWGTDLGANFVGSYTYYTLGSPFFWFMTLFPADFAPYLMAPLLCVKFALISLFAFTYIRRFVTKPQSALIGGLLFAFSSFNLYNVFFQFQDAFMYFPLMLIGLEEFVVNKRKGIFALTVAINCLANYFFFIGECVFLVIYFIIRTLMDKRFSVRLSEFFLLAAESIIGVLIAGILFIPSIYQVLDVPRSTNILKNWNFLFFSNEQRYGLLIESFFFPPEVSARNNMFTEANAKWSSVALYLPLFSMAGVIAFIKGAKKHWASVLLGVCLLMAFIPGLNAAFTMFNDNYYTRWFYMPELICCLATAYALEREDFDFNFGNKICAGVVSVMSVLALFAPFTKKVKDTNGKETEVIVPRLLAKMDATVYIQIFIAVVSMICLYFVIRTRKTSSKKFFTNTVLASVIAASMVLGFYFIGVGRLIGPKLGRFNQVVSAEFQIDDPDFYRIEGVDETNNFNMFCESSSLKSFTSIIPGSTFDLYDALGLKRTVNSAPEYSNYAFRAMARVKYLMIPRDMDNTKRADAIEDLEIYEYFDTQGDYDIYKTDYALPMGFAYDTYFPMKSVKGATYADKLMVRSVFLTDEQIEKYGDILTKDKTDFVYSKSQFLIDAKEKIKNGVIQFSVTKEGFTAKTRYNSEKLVCFSVPYCKGWSAQINGEPAEVDKINGGLCGIRVPEGLCEITFTYRTPGLNLGIICTVAGILLFAVYVVVFRVIKREKPLPYAHLYELNQTDGVKAHKSYIDAVTSGFSEKEQPKNHFNPQNEKETHDSENNE
ncbi:MAG: YfhO family protein [Oscillospiraceae bacterium]|nr:YfhO family protein [Oscillospiraceae bacterium]